MNSNKVFSIVTGVSNSLKFQNEARKLDTKLTYQCCYYRLRASLLDHITVS